MNPRGLKDPAKVEKAAAAAEGKTLEPHRGDTRPNARDLPFVTPKGKGLNFWSVQPVGDYVEQCTQGEELALVALEYMAVKELPDSFLSWVVMAMPRKEDRTGVEVGFLYCIGTFAALYRRVAGDGFYREHMRAFAEQVEARRESEAQDRSERARHAARARWGKAKRVGP